MLIKKFARNPAGKPHPQSASPILLSPNTAAVSLIERMPANTSSISAGEIQMPDTRSRAAPFWCRRSAAAAGFEALPKAWISRNRHLARDFERSAKTVVAFVRLAMIRIMLRRLAANTSS
jgi:hypothetical protein